MSRKKQVYYGRRGQMSDYNAPRRRKKSGYRYSPIEWGNSSKARRDKVAE